jgi:hypothetical protein
MPERSPSPESAYPSERAPSHFTPPGPSYIQPLLSAEPAPLAPAPRGGAELDLLRRDFQALKARLDATEPNNGADPLGSEDGGGEVIAFQRAAPAPVARQTLSHDEPTPA